MMLEKVIWSKLAELQLDEIYKFYLHETNIKIASKLIRGIIKSPNKLLKSPYIGQTENSLVHRKTKYRYLVYKNYKIIYSIDEKNNLI